MMATSTDFFTTTIPLPKTPTGIQGLDDILLGGLPQGQTTLVSGGPGTGKTLMGLEFLYRGALAGEPGIFVTFEESAESVRRNLRALGWNLQAMEESGKLYILQAEVPPDIILSGEFNIDGLLAIIGGQVQSMGAKRLVIDAMDGLLRIFHNRAQQQDQLYTLHYWLRQQEITCIFTMKHLHGKTALYGILDYLVDCVLQLDQRVVGQITTRRLRVLKYRGSGFLSNEYPYVISARGIEIIPISISQLWQQPLGVPVLTGNRQLDILLGGGFRRAASILLAGSSGTGKTTLASSFALAACDRGERVLYISFEESEGAIVDTMLSPGIDLRSALAAQRLKFLTALPESRGVEEHLLRILHTTEEFQPDYLILETLSACQRMGTERAGFDFSVRLIDNCKVKGITSLYTNQIRPSPPGLSLDMEEISGVGISSLMDTLVLLEQRWSSSEYKRQLLIIKSRGSNHSHRFHPFTISDQGILFNSPLIGDLSDMPEETSQ